MVPAVWVSTVAFDLLRRNGEPLSVLASSRIDPAIHYSNLRRITISHVAAGFPGIVWHVPRRVELLVEWQVLQWVPLMLLRMGSNGEQDEHRPLRSHLGAFDAEHVELALDVAELPLLSGALADRNLLAIEVEHEQADRRR